MGLLIWIIGLVAAAIGTFLAQFLVSLGILNLNNLISGIIWFLISFTTYYAGKKIENEKQFGVLSLNFFVTWAFCTIGVLLGAVVWELIDKGTVVLGLPEMTALFFGGLPLTLGPTATLSLGLRDQAD